MRRLAGLLCMLSAVSALSEAYGADSIGMYAPPIYTSGAKPYGSEWRKETPAAFGKNTTAKLQAFYDMMCERVDLMDPAYSYAETKTNSYFSSCPIPLERAVLAVNTSDVFTVGLYARLYTNMVNWLSRSPEVVSTDGSATAKYPDWQSPLCADIRLQVTRDALTVDSLDCMPCNLTRFGFTRAPFTPAHGTLDYLASRLRAPLIERDHEVTRDSLDAAFCRVGNGETPVYVDEIAPETGGGDSLRWGLIYSFDRICSDLSSRNVTWINTENNAISLTNQHVLVTETRQFDNNAIRAFILSNCVSSTTNPVSQDFSIVSARFSKGETEYTEAQTPSSSVSVSLEERAAHGYVLVTALSTATAQYESFVETGRTPIGLGNTLVHYRRTLYDDTTDIGNCTVMFTNIPAQVVYADRVSTTVSANRTLFSSNAAFTERPEYFGGVTVTAVAGDTSRLYIPGRAPVEIRGLVSSNGTSRTPNITSKAVSLMNTLFDAGRIAEEYIDTSTTNHLTVRISPLDLEGTVSFDEFESDVVNSSGSVVMTKTFLAKDDGQDHYPTLNEAGTWNDPDPDKGESVSNGYVPSSTRTSIKSVPFSSSYSVDQGGFKGAVTNTSESFPHLICENQYKFTGWSGHVGPFEDTTGPGDYEPEYLFDAIVDASAAPGGDGSSLHPFRTIDEAISAVDPRTAAASLSVPEGSADDDPISWKRVSRPVSGFSIIVGGPVTAASASSVRPLTVSTTVPRIGIRKGRYTFPSFLDVLDLDEVGGPAYDVRLVGLADGVVLVKNAKYGTGRTIGDGETVAPATSLEKLTIENSGTRVRRYPQFHKLTFFRCRIVGDLTFRDQALYHCRLFNCRLEDLSLIAKAKIGDPGWQGNYPTLFWNSVLTNTIVDVTTCASSSEPANLSCISYADDIFVNGGSWRAVQVPYSSAVDDMANATIYADSLLFTNDIPHASYDRFPSGRIPYATNSIFFVTGMTNNPPYAVDNIMTNAASFSPVINPRTLTPCELYRDWRKHGFRRYIRQE